MATSTPSPVIETPEPIILPEELALDDSILRLVDKNHPLPKEYVPYDLEKPYLPSAAEVIEMRHETGEHAREMINNAANEGINLYLTKGYVPYQMQSDAYENLVSLLGKNEASKNIDPPGQSEHQTGLALDFTDDPANPTTTTSFFYTPAGQWVYWHAHEYGFILRFPNGKEASTGHNFQPWHYRYVGIDIANAIFALGPDATFEEFYNINR